MGNISFDVQFDELSGTAQSLKMRKCELDKWTRLARRVPFRTKCALTANTFIRANIKMFNDYRIESKIV